MQLMGVMDRHDRVCEVVSEHAMSEFPFILLSTLNEFNIESESLSHSGEV